MILEGKFTTRSPLSHISESISIGSLLNERPILQDNGELIDVFVYNGNAWRGQLRDLCALYLIDKVGIESLSTEKHNFLFSGGKIGGASKFDLSNMREHFRLLPHFALLGGCLDNMMLPSKTAFFDSLPLCQEAIAELPAHVHSVAVEKTYRRMTITREFSRKDDSKSMTLNQTLDSAPLEGDTIQMRMSSELLNSGVELFSRISLNKASDLEKGALFSALSLFAQNGFIGGQHNKGHGKVDLCYSLEGKMLFDLKDFTLKTSKEFDRCLSLYDAHLEAEKETIKGLLS